jgi:hypothetical protein
MLLDNRLQDPADRRRALEQTLKALARVSELTQESSQLANWLDGDRSANGAIEARALIDRVVGGAALEPDRVTFELARPDAGVPTVDEPALVAALVAVVKATARELRKEPCALHVRCGHDTCDVLVGPAAQLPTLFGGPDATDAGPIALERGGLGLSLVAAAIVLDAHRAIGWTVNESRTTVGIRLPLKERAHP